MSSIELTKLFDRAIDLEINEDHIVQSWLTRYVGIQSGLAVAVAVIIGWRGDPTQWLARPLLVALGILGALFALLVAGVIERHLAWQRTYVNTIKAIQGDNLILFQEGAVAGGVRLPTFVLLSKWVLFVLWTLFALFNLATNVATEPKYSFLVRPSANGAQLECRRGCAWKTLDASCPTAPCEFQVDESGIRGR